MKVIVEFHNGEELEAFRPSADAAVSFKVKTLQWGIQHNSQYMAPAKIKGITIVEDSAPAGDVEKPKAGASSNAGKRGRRKADPAEDK